MATKNNPGAFQCYQAALPDEEIFTILGRDQAGPATLEFWASERKRLGLFKTQDDLDRIAAAMNEANKMRHWRAAALLDAEANHEEPVWRQKRQIMDDGPPVCMGEIADPITVKQGLHELLALEGGGFDDAADHVKKMRLIGKMIDAIEANTEYVPSVFEIDPAGFAEGDTRAEAADDMRTHYRAWRTALSWAIRNAPPPTVDQDDASYWRHEREVLDRTFRALGYASGPIPQDLPLVKLPTDPRDDVTTTPGGEPYTLESLDEADIWVCHLEGFRVWQDLDGDKQLWFSQPLDPLEGDWSGAFKVNRSLQSEIIRAMFDRICDDEQVLDDPRYKDRDTKVEVMTAGLIMVHGRPMDIREIESWIPGDWVEGERKLTPRQGRAIYMRPELGMGYGNDAVVDTAPEDLSHAPEVPPHRFSTFVKHGRWAYARGLEIAPMHLPRALEAMSRDGWDMTAVFGQTDSQNIGFIFKRIPEGYVGTYRGIEFPDLDGPGKEALLAALKTNRSSISELFRPCPAKDVDIDLGRQQEP